LKSINKNISYFLLAALLPLMNCAQTIPLITANDKPLTEDKKNTPVPGKSASPELPGTTSEKSRSNVNKVTDISLGISALTLRAGKQIELTAEAILENGEKNTAVEWTTSDKNIVSVNDTGIINALKKGTATVRAVSIQNPEKFSEFKVIVEEEDAVLPVSVVLENGSNLNEINKGDILVLAAFVKYSTGIEDHDIRWESSNPGVASVNDTGVVTGVGKGIVKITAKSNKDNNIISYTFIDVLDPLAEKPTSGGGAGPVSSPPVQTGLLQRAKNENIIFYSPRRNKNILYNLNGDGSNIQKLDMSRFGGFEYPTLSANKENLIFMNGYSENLYTANSDGSNIRQILTPPGTYGHIFPRFSPDGLKVVFQVGTEGDFDIYTEDFDGTHPVKVTDRKNCGSPSWSPDGKKIVFSTLDTVETMNSDGSDTKIIYQGNGPAFPIWSPDGKKIAFRVNEGLDTFDTFMVNSDGTGLKNLTNFLAGSADYAEPNSWSKDSNLLFYATVENNLEELNVADVNSSTARQKINLKLAEANDCCKELTGKIVFRSDSDGGFKLYVSKPDGSNKIKLTGFNPEYSRLSPNKNLVLFKGTDGLYTLKTDGTGLNKVPVTDSDSLFPAWSFDTQLAFTKASGPIIISNIAGEFQVPLPLANPVNGFASLANNSKYLAYASTKTDETPVNIYTFSFDTGEQIQLTDSAYNSFMNWSPDSSKIVFESDRTGRKEIFIMNADGTSQVQLTDFGAYHPNWSPDGKKIAFTSEKEGKSAIYIMDPDGSNVKKLFNNSSFNYILEDWH
jgi:Tol biopolymer transport system component